MNYKQFVVQVNNKVYTFLLSLLQPLSVFTNKGPAKSSSSDSIESLGDQVFPEAALCLSLISLAYHAFPNDVLHCFSPLFCTIQYDFRTNANVVHTMM